MASRGCGVWLAVVVLAMALTYKGAEAQSSSSCTSVLMSMSSCLNFITGNSSSPASSCCSALANVAQSQPQCLCSALGSGAASSLGVAINQTRALNLPNVCNVQTPPVSQCSGAGGSPSTTRSAAAAPAGVPGVTEGPTSDIPSGTGSKTVPTTDESNGSTNIKSTFHLLAFIFSIGASALAIF